MKKSKSTKAFTRYSDNPKMNTAKAPKPKTMDLGMGITLTAYDPDAPVYERLSTQSQEKSYEY